MAVEVDVHPCEVGRADVQEAQQAHDQCPAGAAPKQVGEVVAAHRCKGADDDHPTQAKDTALSLVGADQQADLAGQRKGEALGRDQDEDDEVAVPADQVGDVAEVAVQRGQGDEVDDGYHGRSLGLAACDWLRIGYESPCSSSSSRP